MGVGAPVSGHYPDQTVLVWRSDYLCGYLVRPRGTSEVMSQQQLEEVILIGEPYKAKGHCQGDCFGTPCWPSPFGDDGGEPIQDMRERFPNFDFEFKAHWVGFGKRARWYNVIVIRPKPMLAQVQETSAITAVHVVQGALVK
mmetsp:Transcript_6854/g.26494  ORF Transcript_6854/g.26494 Transcript_6854/m.26494 type:complete len:142 (-) Transcript_6854:201-626(-)